MKPIAIYGAGSFGREVLMLIRQINDHQQQWNPVGFYDDDAQMHSLIHDIPVLGNAQDLDAVNEELYIVLAIGNSTLRQSVVNKISNPHIRFATLIHPRVQMAPYQHCTVGEGTIIAAGNILTVDISIGNHVLLNINSTFGHGALIEDFVSVMPGSNISGNVVLKRRAFIGSGASVLNGVTVHEGAVIGSGAVVVQDVPADCTYVGVPAKSIKSRADKT